MTKAEHVSSRQLEISYGTSRRRFVAERLSDIREAYGVKRNTLAKLLDLSPSMITAYESRSTPPEYIIIKLAKFFNVETDYFFRPKPYSNLSTVLFRDFAKAKTTDRERAIVLLKWSIEIERQLSKYAVLPKTNVPDLNLPSNPEMIGDEDIENAALALRKYWGVGLEPISNVIRLLEKNGVIVTDASLEADAIDALMTTDEHRKFYILNNSDIRSGSRKRFTTLHDFAHGLLHRNVDPSLLEVKNYKVSLEWQAHKFATAFLLPRESFLSDIYGSTLGSLSLAKPKWRVSVGAMIYRLYNLGQISSSRRDMLLKDRGRRGWTKVEPFDLDIPVESPVLFKKAFQLAQQHFGVDGEHIAREIGLPQKVVAEMIGVTESELRPKDLKIRPANMKL